MLCVLYRHSSCPQIIPDAATQPVKFSPYAYIITDNDQLVPPASVHCASGPGRTARRSWSINRFIWRAASRSAYLQSPGLWSCCGAVLILPSYQVWYPLVLRLQCLLVSFCFTLYLSAGSTFWKIYRILMSKRYLELSPLCNRSIESKFVLRRRRSVF